MVSQPHFLLFCDIHLSEVPDEASQPSVRRSHGGRWHFVLERLDGPERLEAADSEWSVNRERLALLSVVRGLEALEQPSQVTLVTTSRYVSRGLRYGLTSWREADYKWERFGEQRPVRNSDLWRRVDKALQFHGVKCRLIQSDTPQNLSLPTLPAASPNRTNCTQSASAIWKAPGQANADGSSMAISSDDFLAVASSIPRQLASAEPVRFGVEAIGSRVVNGGEPYSLGALPDRWRIRLPVPSFLVNWWEMAVNWIRWWRGRLKARPAIYGT